MDLEFGFSDEPVRLARPPGANATVQVTRLKGPVGLLVTLAIVGAAAAIGWIYCDMLLAHHAMRAWPEVPAKILRTNMEHDHEGGSRTTAEYRYTFDNVVHQGTKVYWGDSGYENLGSFQSTVYAELSEHQHRLQPFHCFVNPADPSQAVLYRDLRPEMLVLVTALEMILGFPLLMALLGGIVQWTAARRRRLFRRAAAVAHPTEPWLWRADWAAGKIVVSGWTGKLGVTLWALAWNLMAIPLYVHLPFAPAGNFWPRVIGFGLAALGWLWAWWAVSTWRRPKSVLRLGKLPVMCGERFASEIETTARPKASGQFSLALRCIAIEEKEKVRRQNVLWEETKLVSAPAPGRTFGTHSVPVDFALPADCPSTDHVADEGASRVVWRLILDFAPGERKSPFPAQTDSTTMWGNGPAASEGIALFEVPIFSPQAYVAGSTAGAEMAVPVRERRSAQRSIEIAGRGDPARPAASSLAASSAGNAVFDRSALAAAQQAQAKAPAATEMSPVRFAWGWAKSFVWLAAFSIPIAFFYGLYWREVAQWYSMRDWDVVPATMIETRLKPVRDGHAAEPDVRVEYEYKVDGFLRQGQRIAYYPGSEHDRPFEYSVYLQWVENQKSGQPLYCFVNPANSHDAVLNRDLRPHDIVLLAIADLSLGMVFLLIPLGSIYQFFGLLRRWRFRRAQSALHPSERWLWRADWAKGEIVSSNRPIVHLVGTVAVVWNAFAVPLWVFLPAGKTTFGYRMASVVLIGIGWIIALGAIRLWRTPKRSVLRMSAVPATPGGQLVGQIETMAQPGPSGGFRLTLRCVQMQKVWRNMDRRPTTQEEVLWEATRAVTSASPSGGLVPSPTGDFVRSPTGDSVAAPIDVQFAIPPEAPATDDVDVADTRTSRIVWRLVLDADPPTRLSIAKFEIPVFVPSADSAAAGGDAATLEQAPSESSTS